MPLAVPLSQAAERVAHHAAKQVRRGVLRLVELAAEESASAAGGAGEGGVDLSDVTELPMSPSQSLVIPSAV